MSPEGSLEHISDTALLVAACRAIENERPDALIRDPFAARLAGERGIAMARNVSAGNWLQFGVAIRSRFEDELLLDAVRGVHTVAILGSGLDTRPWRLDLPVDLRWIEVDFPEMLDYKSRALAADPPRCRVERLACDLNDASHRCRLYDAIGPDRALMITEGLLMYLPEGTVKALAAEPPEHCGIHHWLLEAYSNAMMRMTPAGSRQRFHGLRAPDHLEGEEILSVARERGWTVAARKSFTRDAWLAASQRILELAPDITKADSSRRVSPDDPSGVYLFQRP